MTSYSIHLSIQINRIISVSIAISFIILTTLELISSILDIILFFLLGVSINFADLNFTNSILKITYVEYYNLTCQEHHKNICNVG